MRIGIIIGRIGDVDGVALETEKWISVLEGLGHEVFILSGRFKGHPVPPERQALFPILSFFSPECEWEQKRAFHFPPDDPDLLLSTLDKNASRIAEHIVSWVHTNHIDMMLSQNASALPSHLSMGIGIQKAVKQLGLPVVTHDHDFAWERGDRYNTPFSEVEALVKRTFPLQLAGVRHVVINQNAQHALRDRFGIDATVVPNVMDFNTTFGEKDDYNRDLRGSLGFDEEDILLFQITRIVRRKGIEVAIDAVKRLADPRVKLVITGSAADDHRQGYYKELVHLIEEMNLGRQVSFAHHKILSQRSINATKVYSLADAYANATACTYFSTYEGFGNAFVECVLAKRPIFVNNYKPVFWPDIGSKGFKVVMLEDNHLDDTSLEQMRQILYDEKEQEDIAQHNYELGKKHFSFEVLRQMLQPIFSPVS
jgi:mannosylglucosylglycerate synthase